MSSVHRNCPDCGDAPRSIDRRQFIRTAGLAAAAVGAAPLWAHAAGSSGGDPESIVKELYGTLSPGQKEKVCFAWDYIHPQRGLLRTHVSNNWHITEPTIIGDFFTKDQQVMIRQIFEGMVQPEWRKKFDKQLEDDAGGFGNEQNIAIFGVPGSDKFEFVLTGRHMTMRCDGNTAEHVAFGGPIFYGHAASGFNEKPDHPGNVFWPQALAANKVFNMLDEKQRKMSLVDKLPAEEAVAFRGRGGAYPGLPVGEMTNDQRQVVHEVLAKLIEPYRQTDRDEVAQCLGAQGGLEKCSLAFYSDGDVGNDKVWDCWRLEGPSFVWYFRGSPHVHVWVNIADDSNVKSNTGNG